MDGEGLDKVLGWGGEVSECWVGQLEQITYRTAPLKPKEGLSGPPAWATRPRRSGDLEIEMGSGF